MRQFLGMLIGLAFTIGAANWPAIDGMRLDSATTQPDGGVVLVYSPISVIPTSQPATIPVVTTQPVPVPVLPAIAYHVAGSNPRPDGFDSVGDPAPIFLHDSDFYGFAQGVVGQNLPGGLSLSNVRSRFSLHNSLADAFVGQGLYTRNVKTSLSADSCVFGNNGWHAAIPAWQKTGYFHGWYCDEDSVSPTITNCIFHDNSAIGLQLRCGGASGPNTRPALVQNCLFVNNSTHAAVVYGPAEFDDCVFYGGGYYFDGSNWVQSGVVLYYPAVFKRCLFIGSDSQSTPPPGIATAKQYQNGWIHSAGNWPAPAGHVWMPPADNIDMTAGSIDNVIVGGPAAFTGAFDQGTLRAAKYSPRWFPTAGVGFIVIGGAGIGYDYTSVLNSIYSNKLSVKDGIAKIRGDLKAMVGQ